MGFQLLINPYIWHKLPIFALGRKGRMDNRNKRNNDIFVDFRSWMNGIREIHYLVLIGLFVLFCYDCSMRKDTPVLLRAVKENNATIIVQHFADLFLYCGFIVLDLRSQGNQLQCAIMWATRNASIMIKELAAPKAFCDWKWFIVYAFK